MTFSLFVFLGVLGVSVANPVLSYCKLRYNTIKQQRLGTSGSQALNIS